MRQLDRNPGTTDRETPAGKKPIELAPEVSSSPPITDELVGAAARLEELGSAGLTGSARRHRWVSARPLIMLAALGAYAALFVPMHRLGESAATILSVLPIGAAAWVWGIRGGVLAGLLAFPVNTLYLSLLGSPGWELMIRRAGLLGSLAGAGVGWIGGRLRDLLDGERRARDAERAFRSAFEHIPVGIALVAPDGRLFETNAALQEMLGRGAAELADQPLSVLTDTEHRPVGDELYRELVQGLRDGYQVEHRFTRADGSHGWTRVALAMVRSGRGRPQFGIAMLDDITSQRAQQAALAHQALHDALTDLPNRLLLLDRLHQAIRTARRSDQRLALLLMDLDRFKIVNDTLGHPSGDTLLQQVGPRVRAQLRESDTLARLGGDEFAVLLPVGGDATIATIVAHKILEALEPPFEVGGQSINIGASIGVAIFPEHGDDAPSLLRRADVAMYAAKRLRSGYATYDESQEEYHHGALALAAELRQALDGHELFLEYQPVVEMRGGGLNHVEALVRWHHPTRGRVLPDDFIAIAEESGLITPLSHWVLETALGQCRTWRDEGMPLAVSINMPAPFLQNPRFLHMFEGYLRAHNLRGEEVRLEITETTIMSDPGHAMNLFARLRAMGVRLCIDDFGTGYSSLYYLKRLSAQEIKIDRAFVGSMTRDRGDAAIVRSTIDLAHDLGLKVIAEGVESREAWDVLAALGCDGAQGFYISPALEAGALKRWIHDR